MSIVYRQALASYITKDSSVIREFFNPARTAGCHKLSLAEASLTPGESTQAHRHPKTEEIYYILRGQGQMRLAGKQEAVAPGAAVFIPAGVEHQLTNSGDGELRLLCFCAPAYAHTDTELTGI